MLLKSGAFPTAYVYPRGMRATRDLLRRRLLFVRHLPAPDGPLLEPRKRFGLLEAIPEAAVRATVEADLHLAEHLDRVFDAPRIPAA